MLFKWHDKSSPLISTHYVMLYPQNCDRIVAIDSVTSFHPTYSPPIRRANSSKPGINLLLPRDAILALCDHPSICPSQVGVLSKELGVSRCFWHRSFFRFILQLIRHVFMKESGWYLRSRVSLILNLFPKHKCCQLSSTKGGRLVR